MKLTDTSALSTEEQLRNALFYVLVDRDIVLLVR